jgi:hypothetical protein
MLRSGHGGGLEKGTPMTAGHIEAKDHEHLPGDGCETVQHDDHLDHIHGDERHREEKLHVHHVGTHSPGDGCETVQHGDHEDHLHVRERHVFRLHVPEVQARRLGCLPGRFGDAG